jgi:hypothetical protein
MCIRTHHTTLEFIFREYRARFYWAARWERQRHSKVIELCGYVSVRYGHEASGSACESRSC